jgi:hypothetical protein
MSQLITQNLRTPISQVPGVGKMDCLYLWSTYKFANGTVPGPYAIFNTIVGNTGQGYATALTLRETSLTSNPGQVPLDQRWECWDIGVELLPVPGASAAQVPIADAVEASNKLVLQFNRGGTQAINLGPISLFPGGAGVTAYSSFANAATTLTSNNGDPSIAARRRLGARSIVLNPGDTWGFTLLAVNSPSNNIVLTASLDVRVSLWMYRDLGISG